MNTKKEQKDKRKARVRARLHGTQDTPRLSVRISNKYFYAQIINDDKGVVVASATDKTLKDAHKTTREERARIIGRAIAEQAAQKGVRKAVFDRGDKKYAGNIKIIAETARGAGLAF